MRQWSVRDFGTPPLARRDVRAAVEAAAEESAACAVEMMKLAAQDEALTRSEARMLVLELAKKYGQD